MGETRDDLHELGEAWDRANAEAEKDNANNLDNGKQGVWFVCGRSSEAWVKSAASAPEAVQKAIDAGIVGSWEAPTAHYIGTEFPEVF